MAQIKEVVLPSRTLKTAEEFRGVQHSQVPFLDRSALFMDNICVAKEGVTKLLKVLNLSTALRPDELQGVSNKVRSSGHIRTRSLKYLPTFQEKWQDACVQISPSFLGVCTL